MDHGAGRRFLMELILRAEGLLSKISSMLDDHDVALPDVIKMINSMHEFVATWEAIVSDVAAARRQQSDENAGAPKVLQVQLKTYEKEEAVLVEIDDEEKPTVILPEFDVPDASLDRFKTEQTGTAAIGCVCSADGEFYMTDLSDRMLPEIMATLQNLTVILDDLPESSNVVFGVRFEGTIMRAARNRADNGGKCFVKLLDTGEVLPYDPCMELYEMPPFYAKLPPFAVKCKLDESMQVANKRAFLLANLYSTKPYRVVDVTESYLVVEFREDSPSIERNGSAEISKELVAFDKKPNFKITLDSFSQNQLEELLEESLNTTNVMKAVMGYNPQDDKRICPFYDPAIEGCFKGSRCQFEHVAKLTDGWTRDRALHKLNIKAEFESPRIGDELELVPTCVVNVDEFYAHVALPELAVSLADLQNKLNDPEYTQDFKVLNHEPHFRELVFAKYSADDHWYRAEVLEFHSSNRISVFYVDFGNRDLLDIGQLCQWDDRFDYLPFQAMHCRVANVQRIRINHTDAIVQLQKAILNQKITAHIVDNMSPWEVLISDEEGNDIGNFLVMTKLAVPRELLVISRQSGSGIPG